MFFISVHFGILIVVKPVCAKALSPITIVFGRLTVVKLEQP